MILQDGRIPQVEMTSCGLNQTPLRGTGYYPAYIACNLFNEVPAVYVGNHEDPASGGGSFPRIMQDGCDGMEEPGYISGMRDQATAGFKYFSCKGITKISILTRGYASGSFEIRTSWDGEVLARIPIDYTNVWTKGEAFVNIPDGTSAVYLTFRGSGAASLLGFELY